MLRRFLTIALASILAGAAGIASAADLAWQRDYIYLDGQPIAVIEQVGQGGKLAIAATQPRAFEAAEAVRSAEFHLTRTVSTSQAVTVKLKATGTAALGTDYRLSVGGQALTPVGGMVSIAVPAGSADLAITLTPIDDQQLEADRTAALTIQIDPDYQLGNDSASATIYDNDGPFGLRADKTTYRVGESPMFLIAGAPAGSRILWSSTFNGQPTSEVDVDYGQDTDSSGAWSSLANAWTDSDVGVWTKTASINGQRTTFAFKVLPPTGDLLILSSDKSAYAVGEKAHYTIAGGAPSARIAWSSKHDGASTGEDLAFYGDYTDANGGWSGDAVAWTATDVGAWTKTATVANQSSTVALTVTGGQSGTPILTQIGGIRVGETPRYTVTSAAPKSQILWSVWFKGVLVAQDQPNGMTDDQGAATIDGTPWQASQIGRLRVVVSVNGRSSAPLEFDVIAAGGGGPYNGVVHQLPGLIEAEDFDEGGEGVAYHDLDAGNNGGGYRATDVDIRGCYDVGGGWQVGWLAATEWMDYSVSVAQSDVYDVVARVASGSAGATIHVSIDGTDVTGPMSFGNTGGWDTWTDAGRQGVSLAAGPHVLRMSVDSGSLDLNSLSVLPTTLVVKTPKLTLVSGTKVGETPLYAVTEAESGAKVRWTVWFNDALVAQDEPNGTTDGSGSLSIGGSTWTAASIGRWRVQVSVAGRSSAPLVFDVDPAASGRGPYNGVVHQLPGLIEAEDFDEGGEGVAYHDLDAGNNGGGYRASDVDIRGCYDVGGGWQVGWFGATEWLEYTVSVVQSDAYDIVARVASGSAGATIHVSIDGTDVTGPMSFGNTGGWDTWTDAGLQGVSLAAGPHILRLSVDSGSLDLNSLTVLPAAVAAPKPKVTLQSGTLVGETPVYVVSDAAAGRKILWTASHDSQLLFQDAENGTTDGTGAATVSGGTWLDAQVGHWEVSVRVAGRSSDPIEFDVKRPGNNPPTVVIIAPEDGAQLTAGFTAAITVSATDPDGGVARVDFYVDGIWVGADDVAYNGWTFDWQPTAGPHVLTAQATDIGGAHTMSAPVNVTVSDIPSPTLQLQGGTMVGEQPQYVISGAQAGTEIRWSSWRDGVAIVADQPYGATDDQGHASITGGTWQASDVGIWRVTVSVGGKSSAAIVFPVRAAIPTPTVQLVSGTMVGEAPKYAVANAEPGADILWTSWFKGVQVATDERNGAADGSGNATVVGAIWQAAHIGDWKVQVSVAGKTSQPIAFVVDAPTPKVQLVSGTTVGQTPQYQVTGGLPGTDIYWTAWRNNVVVSSGAKNGMTDSSGNATVYGSTWQSGEDGDWQVQVTVLGKASQPYAFTVDALPIPTPSVQLQSGTVEGQTPVYQVTGGQPDTDIYWTAWRNNVLVSSSAKNGKTDLSGNATVSGSTWQAGQDGDWQVQVTVLGKTSQPIAFKVLPLPTPSVQLQSGTMVGQTPQYLVTGGQPDTDIYWTAWRNNVVVSSGAKNGKTDSSGNATVYGSTWQSGEDGDWQVQVTVLGKASQPFTFKVDALPIPTPSVQLQSGMVEGQTPVYHVTGGQPDTDIYWTAWRNNVLVSSSAKNGKTDLSGNATVSGSTWQAGQDGDWQVQVTVLGKTSQPIAFKVLPLPTPSVQLQSGSFVGQTPQYLVTGGQPNTQIFWTSWRNNVLMSSGAQNGTTDPQGNATVPGSTWQPGQDGTWQVQVTVLGKTSQPLTFAVQVPTPTVQLQSGLVEGQTPQYRVTGAQLNTQIFWTSWRNNVLMSSGAQNGTTDPQGNATVFGSTWQAGQDGNWQVQVTVGGKASLPITFTVQAIPTPSVQLQSGTFVGQTPQYRVTGGQANSQILWTSWRNNVLMSSGAANGATDPSGNQTVFGSTWQPGQDGTWQVQVTVAGKTSLPISFAVQVPTPTVQLQSGSVEGQTPQYRVTGAQLNTQIFWTSWRNNVLMSSGAQNGTTDPQGNATVFGSTWQAGQDGNWQVQVTVGGKASLPITFTVQAIPTPSVQLQSGTFVGQTPQYRVTGGQANTQIFWAVWRNSVLVSNAANGATDPSGNANVAGGTWQAGQDGFYQVQVTVAGKTSQPISFTVQIPTPSVQLLSGTVVGQTPQYRVTGGQPNTQIFWTVWRNNIVVSNGANGSTDSFGNRDMPGGTWQVGQDGFYQVQVTVAGKASGPIGFTVQPPPTPQLQFFSGNRINQQSVFKITGAPAFQSIYWTVWVNNRLVAVDAGPNGMTDGFGNATIYGQVWGPADVGSYQVQARVGFGGPLSTFAYFSVF